MESILAKTCGWLWALFPAAVGSSLSIFLGKDKMQGFNKFEICCTFFFGVSLAHLIGGAAIEYWHINPLGFIASSIQVSIGFMGMAVLAEAKLQVPLAITAIRRKLLGE